MEMIEANAFRTFIRIYSLFKSQQLNANIKLTLHKALISSVMTYACLGFCGRRPSNEIVAPAKQGSPRHWQFYKVHTGPRIA
jgi:hypothetical protein